MISSPARREACTCFPPLSTNSSRYLPVTTQKDTSTINHILFLCFYYFKYCNRVFYSHLCITQLHLRPAVPPPPSPGLLRGICPPCQSRGWGICKFCPGICQSRGHSNIVRRSEISTLFKHGKWLSKLVIRHSTRIDNFICSCRLSKT